MCIPHCIAITIHLYPSLFTIAATAFFCRRRSHDPRLTSLPSPKLASVNGGFKGKIYGKCPANQTWQSRSFIPLRFIEGKIRSWRSIAMFVCQSGWKCGIPMMEWLILKSTKVGRSPGHVFWPTTQWPLDSNGTSTGKLAHNPSRIQAFLRQCRKPRNAHGLYTASPS